MEANGKSQTTYSSIFKNVLMIDYMFYFFVFT